MDVFISWSGPSSKKVAEVLRKFLPLMINDIHPFVSAHDIEAGARWTQELFERLEAGSVGIVCVTPTSLQSTWLHFEAGALAKSVEGSRVCPYLVGVEPADLKGPLTLFQGRRANEEETKLLVENLNSKLADKAIGLDQLNEAFSTFWPKLKEALDAAQQHEPSAEKRKERDMLEELLELVRGQTRGTSRSIVELLDPVEIYAQLRTIARDIHGDNAEVISVSLTPKKLRMEVSNDGGTTILPVVLTSRAPGQLARKLRNLNIDRTAVQSSGVPASSDDTDAT